MKKKDYFTQELTKITNAEKMYTGPFSLYDKEGIEDFKDKIDKMNEYDEGEVECCEGCKSLFTYEDDFGNTWCGKCNSLNYIEICKDIFEYEENYGHIWGFI